MPCSAEALAVDLLFGVVYVRFGEGPPLVLIRMPALAPEAQGHRPQALQTQGEAWAPGA